MTARPPSRRGDGPVRAWPRTQCAPCGALAPTAVRVFIVDGTPPGNPWWYLAPPGADVVTLRLSGKPHEWHFEPLATTPPFAVCARCESTLLAVLGQWTEGPVDRAPVVGGRSRVDMLGAYLTAWHEWFRDPPEVETRAALSVVEP